VPLILAVFVSSMLVPLLDMLSDRPLRICNRTWCPNICGTCLKIEQKFPNAVGESVTSVLTLRLPNALALVVVLAICASVMGGVGLLIWYSISHFVDKLPDYVHNVEDTARHVNHFINDVHFGDVGKGNDTRIKDEMLELLTDSQQTEAATKLGISIVEGFMACITTGALVLLYVVFILLGRTSRTGRKGYRVTYQVERQLKLYISWKFLISLGTGAAVGFSLFVFGVPLAAVFGIVTFCLNFIPTVGLLIAVLLPFPLVYFSNIGTLHQVGAMAVPYGINLLVSNFVEPLVFGSRLELHPVVVLFALVFWYMMWGVAGAFLSVPIMSVIKICCANMSNPTAQWFARTLTGNVEDGGGGELSPRSLRSQTHGSLRESQPQTNAAIKPYSTPWQSSDSSRPPEPDAEVGSIRMNPLGQSTMHQRDSANNF
jgi:predicted PurR-regulated permease PerM